MEIIKITRCLFKRMKDAIFDSRPKGIKDYEVGTGIVEYKGKKTPYTILSRERERSLPGFLGYPSGKHLFISEDVPEKFRIFQLIHEIIEFKELKGQKGRCVKALERELAFVPEEIKEEYLEYRKNFFARLIKFYKERESTDADFKAEITASYEYLQDLDKKAKI